MSLYRAKNSYFVHTVSGGQSKLTKGLLGYAQSKSLSGE